MFFFWCLIEYVLGRCSKWSMKCMTPLLVKLSALVIMQLFTLICWSVTTIDTESLLSVWMSPFEREELGSNCGMKWYLRNFLTWSKLSLFPMKADSSIFNSANALFVGMNKVKFSSPEIILSNPKQIRAATKQDTCGNDCPKSLIVVVMAFLVPSIIAVPDTILFFFLLWRTLLLGFSMTLFFLFELLDNLLTALILLYFFLFSFFFCFPFWLNEWIQQQWNQLQWIEWLWIHVL